MRTLFAILIFISALAPAHNRESPFSNKMFGTTPKSDEQTNKQTEQIQTKSDVYINNLETFAKRVTNFILNECEEAVNNKQNCFLLREFKIPTSYYGDLKDISTDISLQSKLTKIHELFDLIQKSEILNLESNNLTFSQEKGGYLYLKSIGDTLPMLLFLSYFMFSILVAYAVLSATINKLTVLSVMFCLFLFTFLVSVPYEYLNLYQEAIAERNLKLSKNIPEECLTGQPSLWDTFMSQFSFSHNQCEEWHAAFTSNPLLMVSPAKAFSVAFAKFFTGPLVEISTTISKSFSALLTGVPVQWQLPLLIATLILLLVLICIGCGYSFNFTPLISFKPTRNQRPETVRDLGLTNLNPNPVGSEEKRGASLSPIKVEVTINTQSTPQNKLDPINRKALQFDKPDFSISEENVKYDLEENSSVKSENSTAEVENDSLEKENLIPLEKTEKEEENVTPRRKVLGSVENIHK